MTSLLKILKNDEFILSEQVVEIPDVELDNLNKIRIDSENDEEYSEQEETNQAKLDDETTSKLMEQAKLQAEAERQEILNKTQIECEQLKRQAYEEAYKDAMQEKTNELENCILSAFDTLSELKVQIIDYMRQYEENIHVLSTDIASKILAKKIEKDDTEILELVKHGLDSVKNAEWISVTLSDKAEKLYSALAEELKVNVENKKTKINLKDLPLGSCRIETPNGMLDISISEQLENLKECFR